MLFLVPSLVFVNDNNRVSAAAVLVMPRYCTGGDGHHDSEKVRHLDSSM